MYNLGEDKTAFNNAIYATSRTVYGKVDVWEEGSEEPINTILDNDELQDIVIERGIQAGEALIGNAISKKYTIKIIDRTKQYTFTGKRMQPYIGIYIGQEDPCYIHFPQADVYEAEYDESSKVWTVTCYDDMQKLDNTYIQKLTFEEELTAEGEISLSDYTESICALAGLTLHSNTFFLGNMMFTPNNWSDEKIEEDDRTYPNLSGNETLREVISRIAEAALSNAVINKNGELEFISIVKTFDELSDITITDDEYFSCKINEKFGPINTIVLSQEEQNNNVYYPAATERDSVYINELEEVTVQDHIDDYGLNEFKINDNPFLDRSSSSDDTRYDYLQDIFNQVKDLSYYAYALDWRGNPSLDEGDRIAIAKPNSETDMIETTYFGDKMTFNGALRASAEGRIVSQTAIEYERAATYRNLLRKTELKVDKYTGQIESIASLTTSTTDKLRDRIIDIETISSSLVQTAQDITVKIKKSGGDNLIKNSSGRGGINSWNVSEDGIVETGDDAANTISNSYFKISSGSMSQSFTLAAGDYSLAFKYKNNGANAYVNINNEPTNILEVIAEESTEWIKAEAITLTLDNERTFNITIGSDRQSFMIADIILSEGSSEVWSQAADEIYTTGISIDSDGLHINQSEKTEFIADSSGVRIIRANSSPEQIIALFDIYGTTTKQLSSEGQITAGKVNIIPINKDDENAVMTVIFD